MVLFRGTCDHVIYTPVDEVKNMASSDDYDSDLDRVYDILNDTSESEFSGFDSEDVSSSSDEEIDENPVDWQRNNPNPQHLDDNNNGDIPTCALRPGPKLPDDFNKDTAGPLDYFSLFVPEEIYERMARETNAYAELCQQDKGERDSAWTETSGEEIRAYLGLNIVMGASPRHQYEDYWKDDDFLGCVGFKSVMSRDRYAKLTQYLHLNSAASRQHRDHPEYHPINRVKPLYDVSRANFKEFYQHSTEISIDEAMKGFKGRTELRQYMPAKPEKFGIKFWARCDGRTSYMSDYVLYTGKRDRTPMQQRFGLGYSVVHSLTRDLVGLNHHIYHDRFFTSVQLAEAMLEEDIYTCGTVNSNRKDLPPPLRVKKAALRRELPNRGDSVSYFKDSLNVTAWNDNNIVMILHNNSSSDPVRCERQVGRQRMMIPQPKAISDYNQFMNGVDLHDQLRKRYACGRPSKKYWKYLLWFIVDCCRVNAYIVYKESSSRTMRKKRFTHLDFIVELGRTMIGNFTSRKRVCVRESLPPLYVENNRVPHVFQRLPGKRRRCKECHTIGIRKEVVTGCPICNIHMCKDCFCAKH